VTLRARLGRGILGNTDVLGILHVLSIRDGMIAAHFDKPFVERVSDHVVIMDAWLKESEEKRLKFETSTHATEFEVPEPQFPVGKLSVETVTV